jgi:hypothetical protein
MTDRPFPDDVVASISEYMNANQPDINLLIVQVHGGRRTATAADLIDVDGTAVTFRTDSGGTVTVPWARPISRREHIRRELMELYETALATRP